MEIRIIIQCYNFITSWSFWYADSCSSVENKKKLKFRSNLMSQSSSLTYKKRTDVAGFPETSVPTPQKNNIKGFTLQKKTENPLTLPLENSHICYSRIICLRSDTKLLKNSSQSGSKSFHSHQQKKKKAVQSQDSITKLSPTILHSNFFSSRNLFFFYGAVNYGLCVRIMWVVLWRIVCCCKINGGAFVTRNTSVPDVGLSTHFHATQA